MADNQNMANNPQVNPPDLNPQVQPRANPQVQQNAPINPANIPLPPNFALTPATANHGIIDYTTKAGAAIWKAATAPLSTFASVRFTTDSDSD